MSFLLIPNHAQNLHDEVKPPAPARGRAGTGESPEVGLTPRRVNPGRFAAVAVTGMLALLLSACGGGDPASSTGPTTAGTDPASSTRPTAGTEGPSSGGVSTVPASTTTADASRLAQQASFGPTEALIAEIRSAGAAAWVGTQMGARGSRYSSGGDDAIHRHTGGVEFCDVPSNGSHCWRDNFSSEPLLWDFYRNAMRQNDQLRQRVAWALQQIAVVSNREVNGTYGLRNYHNRLLDLAFDNYREVLRSVTLSPVMGDYLNNVNNHRNAPNENFARELLQLFAIGTCELAADGSLIGGGCKPTYNNEMVRAYAHALTGWTYPLGGATSWGCWPRGANCQHYGGNMVPVAEFHDTQARSLLSGVTVPAGSSAELALERVLDSLMQHPSMPAFIGRQLIQHLASSNPSPAYVKRVGEAFAKGSFAAGGRSFGDGRRGSLAATVAAVLLDDEARNPSAPATGGKLREPVLMFTGVLRALNGKTDGDSLSWWWGGETAQHVFRPPSVFNFYAPDYPVAGIPLVGPAFGIQNTTTGVARLNFLTYLFFWGGSAADPSVPGATGTAAELTPFETDASEPGRLIDRLSALAYGEPLPAATRDTLIKAVSVIDRTNTASAKIASERVRQAAYLVFASPRFQVQR